MRILIIGGTRFIGPYVVNSLSLLGYEITLFHRGQTNCDLPESIDQIFGDRRNPVEFKDKLKDQIPDIVLDMIPAFESDAQSVMQIFSGIARRVVSISSQDVYQAYGKLIKIESGPPDPVPLAEDAPLREKLYPYREQATGPEDKNYNYEKILVERAVMNDPELPGTVLRLPMVYGPGDYQHRLFPYLKRMDDGRSAILLAESTVNWRWSKGYVEDIASAIVMAVTDDRAAGKIFNVAETEGSSESEWIETIGKAVGWEGKVVSVPDEKLPAHLDMEIDAEHDLVTDTGRIREILGYKEIISSKEAIQRTIEWERTNPPAEIDPTLFDYDTEDTCLADIK